MSRAPHRMSRATAQNRLAVLWPAGVPVRDIAAELGKSTSAVCALARRMGLPARRPRRDVDIDTLGAMVADGAPVARIAAAMGCSTAVIRRRIAAQGLARRDGRTVPVDDGRIRAMCDDGASLRAISAATGHSVLTIRRPIKALGIERVSLRGRARKEIDEDRLRRLIAAGDSIGQAACAMGLAPQTVAGRIADLGLVAQPGPPSRPAPVQARVRIRAVPRGMTAAGVEPAKDQPGPRVDDDVTEQIRESGGRYRALGRIAAAHGLAVTEALRRWHSLSRQVGA